MKENTATENKVQSQEGYIMKNKKGHYIKCPDKQETTTNINEAYFFAAKEVPHNSELNFIPVTKEVYTVTRIRRFQLREYVLVDKALSLHQNKPIYRGLYSEDYMPRTSEVVTDNPLSAEKYSISELESNYPVWDGIGDLPKESFYVRLVSLIHLEQSFKKHKQPQLVGVV